MVILNGRPHTATPEGTQWSQDILLHKLIPGRPHCGVSGWQVRSQASAGEDTEKLDCSHSAHFSQENEMIQMLWAQFESVVEIKLNRPLTTWPGSPRYFFERNENFCLYKNYMWMLRAIAKHWGKNLVSV